MPKSSVEVENEGASQRSTNIEWLCFAKTLRAPLNERVSLVKTLCNRRINYLATSPIGSVPVKLLP